MKEQVSQLTWNIKAVSSLSPEEFAKNYTHFIDYNSFESMNNVMNKLTSDKYYQRFIGYACETTYRYNEFDTIPAFFWNKMGINYRLTIRTDIYEKHKEMLEESGNGYEV
jgi:hypothetical protein